MYDGVFKLISGGGWPAGVLGGRGGGAVQTPCDGPGRLRLVLLISSGASLGLVRGSCVTARSTSQRPGATKRC
ncbi:hypothetical protein E2C01_049177 [Portunus trituberculatus]|uniref:Uncharacterized protein n=1 Tax=Portunus trituberculatus TaxID=210409 RepID=A0A5B7GCZ8_PORTR|nr:hypothetical protein [Portunus trituberculatus]